MARTLRKPENREVSLSAKDVADILDEIGVMLEISGENLFKSRAYYSAARALTSLDEGLDTLIEEHRLSSVPGIGTALTQKITELVTTGKLAYYDRLKESIPRGLIEMLKIPGLGPKKINMLHKALSIETIGELEYACKEHRLQDLKGFGSKTQEKVLQGIAQIRHYHERRLYAEVIGEAETILSKVRSHQDVIAAEIAGSLRRCMETAKDIDILAATEHPHELSLFLASLHGIDHIIAQGDTKVSVAMDSGINVDFRLVTPVEFPYALHHFTGSKEHNIAMRGRAKTKNLKMNEYGLFSGETLLPCHSEEDIFEALGLSYIPPELREDRGEIEAAEMGTLLGLVDVSDIRGLLHLHTQASDGADSIEALIHAARDMGIDYIGISDHSKSAAYAGGLSEDAIRAQHDEIDFLNERYGKPYVLKGIESDILPDGSLDYDDVTLETFDFVIAAVHSHFRMSEEEMTLRIIHAMDNPATTILAHPTGRLLLAREPYRLSMEQILSHAAERGTIIELNANPHRLDLDWRWCRHAKDLGVKIAINPDAHTVKGLGHIRFGVNIARKGWLSPSDCINCLGLAEIKKVLKNRDTSLFKTR